MSTFKNITTGDLWLNAPDGSIKSVKYTQSFEGSNYFKQFTSEKMPGDMALLRCTLDDGIPWIDSGTSQIIPNKLKAIEVSVPADSQWGDFDYDFADPAVLGGVARFMQITVDNASAEIKINGQDSSVFTMDSGSMQSFNTNELLIQKVSIRNPNSGGNDSFVRILAAAIVNL